MKALNALSESFLENHPTQAALVLEGVEEKALALFFSRLAPRVAGKVFELSSQAFKSLSGNLG